MTIAVSYRHPTRSALHGDRRLHRVPPGRQALGTAAWVAVTAWGLRQGWAVITALALTALTLQLVGARQTASATRPSPADDRASA